MSSNIRVNRICQYCQNEFEAKTTVTKYCSEKCGKAAYNVYFGETDHGVSCQTDHPNCWRSCATGAIDMVSKVMI